MVVGCPGMTRVDSYRSNVYEHGWTSVANLMHGQKRDRYRTDSIPPQRSLRQNSLINSKVGRNSIQGTHAWVPLPHIIAKTQSYLTSLPIQYLNDSAMDTYLNELFPSPSPMSRVLSSIRIPVLKAVILRYSLLLRDGGIYTDMDTASVRPFKEWGTTGVNDLVSNGSLLYLSEPLTLN